MNKMKMRKYLYGRWGEGLRSLGAFLRDCVFPEGALCRGCGKISDGSPLCPACRERLQTDDAARAWTFTAVEPDLPAYSLRPHTGLARQMVLNLKHQSEACLAAEMARLILPLPAWLVLSPETVVTWVTMPRRRLRRRGIDHGHLLAEATAECLHLSCRQLLLRTNDHARSQARLNQAGRVRNLVGVFSPKEHISFPVLLVDDVLTTGTTARRCAEALRRGGAREIMVLTFTKAVR